MQPDDEAPLTLSKWPFYLGDLLLVVTALAIAILGKWQLSDIQVISCVVAVALGAAIFGLPFVVEYSMRVREERDDRSSEIRLLKGHLQQAEAALLQCDERLNELESGSGSVDQRYELLASAVDHKLDAGSQHLATLSQQVAVIETFKTEHGEALAAVKVPLEALSVAPADDASTQTVTVLQAELAALEARLTEIAEPMVTIESRLIALEDAAKVAAEAVTAGAPEESRPASAPRQRRKKADSGLLHRAIKEQQGSASTAVSRIIDSKSKLVEISPEAEAPTEPEAQAVAVADAPEITESEELVVELDPAEAVTGIEALPEDIEVSLGVDLIEDDELLEAAADAAGKSADADAAADLIVEVTAPAASESEVDVPVDLFGEAVPPATRRARTKANDAVFTVSILIGIGNKPFLRGSGGGLNWEVGVAMDFEEIGKWRWVAPADLVGPVELQVYRNDEDADRKGRHTLEPGQKLEVGPVF
jgi:hypothetical protein